MLIPITSNLTFFDKLPLAYLRKEVLEIDLYRQFYMPLYGVLVFFIEITAKYPEWTITTRKVTSSCRSSHWSWTINKAVFKNFAIFAEKHLCWSLFLIKLQAFRRNYCEIFKKSFSCRTPLMASSDAPSHIAACEWLLLLIKTLTLFHFVTFILRH